MSTNVLTRLSDEHDTLLPLIVEIHVAAEAQDMTILLAKLLAGRAALTEELDAHIAFEEDVAFSIEISVHKLAVCIGPIFLFFHPTLVK